MLKMVLDDIWEDNLLVIAIHCSLEDYRLAFIINKYLKLRLQKTSSDIDHIKDTYEASYSHFIFEDTKKYVTYNLISNKCKAVSKEVVNDKKSSLFNEEFEHYKQLNLIPEYARADYLLKIETESQFFPKAQLLAELNQITQIVTAYEIEINQLKSKTNLIFE